VLQQGATPRPVRFPPRLRGAGQLRDRRDRRDWRDWRDRRDWRKRAPEPEKSTPTWLPCVA